MILYNAAEMTATFCQDCPPERLAETTEFFEVMLNKLKEGGMYAFPAAGKVFVKVGDKFAEKTAYDAEMANLRTLSSGNLLDML